MNAALKLSQLKFCCFMLLSMSFSPGVHNKAIFHLTWIRSHFPGGKCNYLGKWGFLLGRFSKMGGLFYGSFEKWGLF